MNKSNSKITVFGRRGFLSKVTFAAAIGLLGTSKIKSAFPEENSCYLDQAG
jgi:hypothetical protein